MSKWMGAALLGLLVMTGACAEPAPEGAQSAAAAEEREAPAALEVGKADVPGWFAWAGTIRSGKTVEGAFTGWDSAHLFSFNGSENQWVTVSFEGAWPAWRGAAIAIYDAATGERLARERAWSQSVTLEGLALPATGEYYVGVYSLTWWAKGAYTVELTASCGGKVAGGSATCEDGAFCAYAPGASCGWADAPGTCVDKPEFCIQNCPQVCGCDGKTYCNACIAANHGVSTLHDGPCETEEPVEPEEPEQQICGGILGAECPDDHICQYDIGVCGQGDQTGVCVKAPDMCIALYQPVCGCDGKTYSNSCHAAGVGVLHDGPCACVNQPTKVTYEDIAGDWFGQAEWAIEYSFHADGTFQKRDLVSPCPPDAFCFWSGIVANSGWYTIAGDTIELTWYSPDNGFGVETPDTVQAFQGCDGQIVLHDDQTKLKRQ